MGSRSPAGPRRLGTATRIMRIAVPKAFCVLREHLPAKIPKRQSTPFYPLATQGFRNVWNTPRVVIAPLSETPRVSPCEPLCALAGAKTDNDSAPGDFEQLLADFRCTEIGAGERHWRFSRQRRSRQPAVRTATRVCGFWKLTLFSRFPERFDAKFEKSRRKAPCHNGLRRRFDRKSVRFIPL